MAAGRLKAGGGFRTAAVAASVAVHALGLSLILWRLGTAPRYTEPPVMNVELTPGPRAQPNRTRRRGAVSSRAGVAARPALRAESPTPPGPDVPPPVVLSPGREDRVALALRSGLGCDHPGLLGLTRAQRQDCQDRRAAAALHQRGVTTMRLDLDRRGFAASRDLGPFLARIPKDGCVPRVTEKELQTPGGAKKDVTGAVTCAWSF